MDSRTKAELLNDARRHLSLTTGSIEERLAGFAASLERERDEYYKIKGEAAYEDRQRAFAVGANTTALRDQLVRLEGSPYFARCDLAFDDAAERPYYFAKFPASELGIYSWTSPLAALRFDDPGIVSYGLPNGSKRLGRLSRRDQFLIARNEIRLMTSESETYARELVFQEYFSNRKTGFMLPEIVAQMERAQDQVIRAPHAGPLVIAGPAGSGKTTLALHRIAYLRQSPETADLYPADGIIVFVHDYRTQDYFSHLLPELGIGDVTITTFPAWAIGLLELKRWFHRPRATDDEGASDAYELAKIKASTEPLEQVYDPKRIRQLLTAIYEPFMDTAARKLLQVELRDGALDRHDLTLLLRLKRQADKRLSVVREHHAFLSGGRVRTTRTLEPLAYSLVLVDEFQNYLPGQLRLMHEAAAARFGSMLYVGDLGQRTQFGATGDWADFDEVVPLERQIRLGKVYRNTRQILEFIRGLGYTVEIPAGVTEGTAVEIEVESLDALTEVVDRAGAGSSVGILAKDAADLEAYETAFAGRTEVHCLTVRQAQGVEFDTVCLVGVRQVTGEVTAPSDERRLIDRDLLYVALTRAVSHLVVFGSKDVLAALRHTAAST